MRDYQTFDGFGELEDYVREYMQSQYGLKAGSKYLTGGPVPRTPFGEAILVANTIEIVRSVLKEGGGL